MEFLLPGSIGDGDCATGNGFCSWQENDEEWLAVSEWDGDEKDNEDLGLGTILGTAQTPQKETNDKEVKDDEKET